MERNIISNSGSFGVWLGDTGTNSNLVAGNYIGTDAGGTLDYGNAFDGVRIENGASNNTVGGAATTQRNVISGNNSNGVDIRGGGTNNNSVIGNYLGLSVSGADALGNFYNGVSVAFGALATRVISNVSSSNGDIGVIVYLANDTVIQGNLVGLDATGTLGRGNLGNAGILVGAANNTLVGTNGDGVNDIAERNVISGNAQEGIQIENNSSGTIVAATISAPMQRASPRWVIQTTVC